MPEQDRSPYGPCRRSFKVRCIAQMLRNVKMMSSFTLIIINCFRTSFNVSASDERPSYIRRLCNLEMTSSMHLPQPRKRKTSSILINGQNENLIPTFVDIFPSGLNTTVYVYKNKLKHS